MMMVRASPIMESTLPMIVSASRIVVTDSGTGGAFTFYKSIQWKEIQGFMNIMYGNLQQGWQSL